MKLKLEYGRNGLSIEVPDKNLLSVLEMKEAPPVSYPQEAVTKALIHPIGCPPFTDLVKGKKTACLVVSDKTRPVANREILPPVLKILDGAGIRTTILIACGMHSPTEGKDLRELLGEEIAEERPIVNHNAEDLANLIKLGHTPNGVDILVNRLYCESNLKILTGFIEPHFMAGFSGGRKSVCPGIAGLQTMRYAHSPALLESPYSAPGILEDNPLHEFACSVAKMAGVDFIVNVTQNRDKKITGIFAGDLEKAHSAGVAFCRSQAEGKVVSQADIVITTNAGYPLDQDFYQTVKGMVAALDAVKPGGTILIASECSKGLGSSHFRKMLTEMKSPDAFISMISQPGFFIPDQWEPEELVKVLRKAHMMLYTTGLSAEEKKVTQCEIVNSIENGIQKALLRHGPEAKITVIPAGPYVLATVQD